MHLAQIDGPGEFFICRSSDDKEVISKIFFFNFNNINDRLVPMIFIIAYVQAKMDFFMMRGNI